MTPEEMQEVRIQAQREFYDEQRRRAVEAEKQRIRERMNRGWFKRLFPSPPPLVIQWFAARLNITVHETALPSFKPVDAAPQFLSDRTVHRFEELQWFAAPLVETKELIVDPDKVGEILAKIAEAQLPEQAAIRERNRLRERREGMSLEGQPRRQFHAQVLSIAA